MCTYAKASFGALMRIELVAGRKALSCLAVLLVALSLMSCGGGSSSLVTEAVAGRGGTKGRTSNVVISNVAATAIATTSATVTWSTNVAATTQVEYGTTTSYGKLTTLDPAEVTSHSQTLTSLSADTQYHYRVRSKGPDGGEVVSADATFRTAAATEPQKVMPTISGLTVSSVTTSSATIAWATSVATTSQVEYGTTTAYGSLTPLNTALVTSHSQSLSGLNAGTLYHYRVRSKLSDGTEAISSDATFTTAAATQTDTTPPTITGVSASATSNSVFITWTTNEASDSQVEYGTSTGYGLVSPLNATRVTSHSVTITGLNPSTAYNYRVRSKDASGNTAVSANLTFSTFAASASALPTTIGWHSLGDPSYSRGAYLDTALITSPPDGKGSTNQCPVNNFGGVNYRFGDLCKNVINAQSGAAADTRRNRLYLWGGGHGDYSGNEIYALDLNASPVTLRRVTDPTLPPVNVDPNYAAQSSCVAGLPQDQSTPSYTVKSLTRDASGNAKVVFNASTAFVPASTGYVGKGWVKLAGFSDATLNEGPVKVLSVSTTNVPNDTITYRSRSAVAATASGQGSGTATWSSCMPDANGLGCAPNAIHSTQNIGMMLHPTDSTKDVFFKAAGSLACGPGNQTADTWTLPVGSGISASGWRWQNYAPGYSAPSGAPAGFPNVTEFDPATGLMYVMDHSTDNSLYAYDLFGTKGTPNKWYKLTSMSGFQNSPLLSGTIWHDDANMQRYFFAAGGCAAMPINTISRSGGTVTANLAYAMSLAAGSRITVYGVADASFNGGDGTNVYATVASISGNTITYPVNNTTTASSTGGKVISCDRGTVHGVSGVFAANISGGTAMTSREDWTYATLDVSNTDAGNPALGNTCAEFLSGGESPLNGTGAPGSVVGGISPGLTVDAVINKIVGWPNQGTSIYEITPDPANKRWRCTRKTFPANDSTAAPQNTKNAMGAANSTWGTWKRFSYFPQIDAFVLVNAPDQPARLLRTRGSSSSVAPKVTISGVSASGINSSGAIITWTTSAPSSSQVEYGTTTAYGKTTTLDSTQVSNHTVVLSGLTASTTYNYRVRSKGADGVEVVSANAVFTTAAAVTVTDTTPPTVSITAPASGVTANGTITLSASASDNVAVAGVQFRVDGVNVGAEDVTAPYAVSWISAGVSNGTHNVTAVARDAAGNTKVSTAVSLEVYNSPSSSDFLTRCSDPNVVRCFDFDSQTEAAPHIDKAGDGQIRAKIDSSTYASGGGSLQFHIPATSGQNTAGNFWLDFSDDYSVQFGNGSPHGNEFYIQWRQRFDHAFVNLNTSSSGGGGQKQVIVGMGSAVASGQKFTAYSCTDMHLVMTNAYYRGLPVLYHNCGTKDGAGYEGLTPMLSSGDNLLQNAVQCMRRSGPSGFPNCFKYLPDEWMTFQLHVKAGRDYSPAAESTGAAGCQTDATNPCSPNSRNYHRDSTVELWIARENQPAQLVISIPDYDLVQHDVTGNGIYPGSTFWTNNNIKPRYGKIWLLPYETGRTTSVTYEDAYTWYDELIISKRRIPDPNVTTPNAPDSLKATALSSSSVKLDWRINAGPHAESGFKIERCAGDMYQQCYADLTMFTEIATVGAGVNTYTDSTAVPGQKYTYRVSAFNSSGSSSYSNGAMNVPGQPSDLVATVGPAGTAALKWVRNAPLVETGFVIERCAGMFSYSATAPCNSGSAFTKVGQVGAGVTTFTDTGLTPGTTYTWRVKSFNSAGSYNTWQNTSDAYSNKASATAQ